MPVQSVQKFALYEVQDLERAVAGRSDEEVTSWMERQAVHHPTVDWETPHNTHKFLTYFAQKLKKKILLNVKFENSLPANKTIGKIKGHRRPVMNCYFSEKCWQGDYIMRHFKSI